MRIVHFTDTFVPATNGVVTSICNFSVALHNLGHTVSIIAPKPATGARISWKHKHIPVHLISSVPGFFYPDYRFASPFSLHILNLLRKEKPDIIHFHTTLSIGLQGVWIAKLMHIPIIGTFHTYFMEPEYLRLFHLHKVKLDNNQTIVGMAWQIANLFYNQADVVISPSHFTKDDLIQHGIQKPIKVIPNGIDNSFADKKLSKKDLIDTYHLPKEYFLYVGRISQEKSIDILIKSFHEFTKKNSALDLVLVGDGPAKSKLHSLVSSLHLDNRVHFLGMIPNTILMKSRIFRNALAFVITSKSETQCISVVEAMSFGLPIIAVESRALPELVHNNGILCAVDDISRFANALHTVSQNAQMRKEMGKISHKLSKNYSIGASVRMLEELYTSIL